MLFSHSF
jgi:aspartate/methionine/tyrosine aminotransferase